MSKETQFLFISHNKIAMEMAEQLIGVTMQEQGVSRIVAVDMESALGFAELAARCRFKSDWRSLAAWCWRVWWRTAPGQPERTNQNSRHQSSRPGRRLSLNTTLLKPPGPPHKVVRCMKGMSPVLMPRLTMTPALRHSVP
jgi:hypothetical protein